MPAKTQNFHPISNIWRTAFNLQRTLPTVKHSKVSADGMGGRDVGVVRSDVWSYIVAMEYEAILQDGSLVMFYEVQDEEHYFRISLNIYGKVWNSV